MKDVRLWALMRRLQYGSLYFSVLAMLAIGVYYTQFYTAPTCFDAVMNGGEEGIDCNGSCVRICEFSVEQPEVIWAKSFEVVPGQYNAIAYVENHNVGAGVERLEYIMRLYDDRGQITERRSFTSLPENGTYPIFEGRIDTQGRVPTNTTLDIVTPNVWVPSSFDRAQFRTVSHELIGVDTEPRLRVQLENSSLFEAENVEVVATVFDSYGTALTSSRTYVPRINGRSTSEIVFTWPQPIAKTLRSCEVPTDIAVAIDLSGSMNNDGGTPPQPVTDVLKAAKAFIGNARSADQVSLVTFATVGKLVRTLTNDHAGVANSAAALSIDPVEERGYTNTGEAIRLARQELGGERANGNARKVIVMLTDGLATAPDPDPDAYAKTEAAAAKAAGITVYTIGLGAAVNMDFLRSVATEPKTAFLAPGTDDLERIYSEITAAICEEGPSRIDVVPKIPAGFTPLQ